MRQFVKANEAVPFEIEVYGAAEVNEGSILEKTTGSDYVWKDNPYYTGSWIRALRGVT